MTFAKRLVLGTLLVLFFTLLVVVWAAERSLRHDLERELATSLERDARLVREAVPADPRRWGAVVRRIALENAIHIMLIDRTGAVRADSERRPENAVSPDSLLHSADVREALAGKRGLVVERPARGAPELFVSVPGGPGVIRVSRDLGQVDDAVRRARAAVAGGAVFALLLGTLLAFVAARSITQPLTGLTSAAHAIASGSMPRFPRSGIPDIDGLVRALRQMHRQLADRFDELRRERAESAALVESMVEGVIAADGRGRIVTANSAARRLLGYGSDEPLPDLPELFRVKAARQAVDAALGGAIVESREIELDGSVLLVNARPLATGGALLVLHDLTELRRLETVRRDFVANVSHELKTPLTSISGYTETILSDTPDRETSRRFLTTILSNARRMQRLVDDLLDLSRIESGRWQPEPEPVDVAATAQEVWHGLAGRNGGEVTFALEIVPSAPALYADADGVRQILTNLIENSLRYTPSGGRITCRVEPRDGGVALSVHDTGHGIPGEHLPRIFERFYRADPSRSRAEGGTGLGLSIVKHLVEAHDGRVWAESERGRGTAIYCWFPPHVTSS
ncbi:MAG TPA: ATP-binding protein [Gemmatimonadales bacterium]|nr:ATP-binding protein [Gemmatimonadales bacterium]